MHGEKETSLVPRTTAAIVHLVILGIAGWIYFGGGLHVISGWFGRDWMPGDPVRRAILFGFGVILWLRLLVTTYYLLKRKFGWPEVSGVITGLIFYQIGFALCGAAQPAPIAALDMIAIAIFLFGSYLNTGAELARKRFKDDPANQGKLYTEGLFRFARHINYFGDLLWVSGWAMLTRNPWATIMPVLLALNFNFAMIPSLSKYLRERYGDQYDAWAQRTKKFIPFVY